LYIARFLPQAALTTAVICVPYGFAARQLPALMARPSHWLNIGNVAFILPAAVLQFVGRGPMAKLCEDNSCWTVQRVAFAVDCALIGTSYLGVAGLACTDKLALARLPIFMTALVATGTAANRQMQMLLDHSNL
jgi:hypothetical protein